MNSNFTTHHTEEKPTVLLLGGSDQLSLVINHIFSSNNFAIELLNLEKLDYLNLKKNINKNKNVYKIIWIDLGSDSNDNNGQMVAELLQNRPEPLIYFTNYSSLKKKSKLSANKINQKSVFIQDLVSSEEVLSPWTEVFSQFRKKTLLDPEIVFYPSSIEAIKKELEKILFSPPNNQTVLIRGVEIKSKNLLLQVKTFFEKNNQVRLNIKTAPYLFVEENNINFDKTIELPSGGRELVMFLSKLAKKIAKNEKSQKNILKKITPNLGVTHKEKTVKIPKATVPKLNPLFEAEKIKELEKHKKIENKQSLYSQKEIEDEIKTIFKQDRVQKKVKKVVKKIGKTKQISKKQKRKKIFFFLSLFVFGIITGVLFLSGIFFLTSRLQSRYLYAEIEKIREGVALQSPEESSKSLEKSSSFLSAQYLVYSPLLPKQWLLEVDKNLSLFRYLEEYKEIKSRNLTASQELLSFVFSQDSENSNTSLSQQIKKIRMSSDELINSLSTFQLELEGKSVLTNTNYEDINKLISGQKRQLQSSGQLLDALPELLGEKSQKNYLLLLQNNMEVNPGGGVIESVALLSFESGVLKNYQVYDMNSLENSIKGEWEAPDDFKEIFARENILAQESSWFLDFYQTSEEFVKQSEAVFAKKIDGVLGLNLNSVEKILAELGPLDLPVYGEQITAENIVEKIYLKASTDLDAKLGKDSYFTAFFRSLLNKIFDGSASPQLLKTLSGLAKEKEFFISIKNSGFFDVLSWSGKLSQPVCPLPFKQDCQIDSIFQSETNIAANYSNKFVSRSVNHKISLGAKFAQHDRVINFKNTSLSTSWPGGTYKSYLRFVVDKGSELVSIKLDGKTIPKDQVKTYSEQGKKVWGVVLELAPSAEKELLLKYKVPLKNQLSYGFFDQKQAGIKAEPLLIELSHSPTLSPSIIAPQAEVLKNKLYFSLIREGDSLIMLQFK